MSTPADVIRLPSRSPRAPRFAASARCALADFPLIPTLILVAIALVAIFANQLAPHNPEIGSLTARFKPPFWHGRRQHRVPARHRPARPRCAVAADFRRAGVDGGRVHRGDLRRRRRHRARHLSGYLGGWVDQVIMRLTDTWLALPALTFAIFLAAIVGPSMWNIVIILGDHLLDPLCPRDPRRGALVEGTGVRPAGDRRRLLEMDDHAAPHPAQRHQLRGRARHPDARRGDHRRGDAVVPRRRRAAAGAGLGPDAVRRQAGPDGRLLVADRVSRAAASC